MLKSLDTSRTFVNFVEKKCAELFFRNEYSFHIVCTHCDLKTFDFEDFLLHFRNVHLAACNAAGDHQQLMPIKTEQEGTVDESATECDVTNEYKHFMEPLAELEEIPLSPVNNSGTFEQKSDILSPLKHDTHYDHENKDNDAWKPDIHSDDASNSAPSDKDAEDTPRILKSERKSTTTPVYFKCTECNSSYKFAKNLDRHVKNVHSEDTTYTCHKCNKVFNNERKLNSHQRNQHDGFPCAQCDKVYTTKEALRVHEYKHSGVRGFHCDKEGCGKSFYNPKQLISHKRIVHQLERNFVCEVCGYRTKGQASLIVHKRSHTGEKPFICRVCGKGFASKSLLCEHEPIHSGERPFVCDVCGAAFSRPKTLYHHKHLHSGVKKFVCKLCGRAYTQMAGLAGHMRQHKAEQI